MQTQLNPLYAKLIAVDDVIDFLIFALELRKNATADFSLAQFSRECGFKSRSRISELMQRQRGLTIQLQEGLISGLGLTDYAADLFRNLAMECFPKLNLKQVPMVKLREQRARLVKILQDGDAGEFDSIYGSRYFPRIFAALGEQGATLDEITERTGLSRMEARQSLTFMRAKGFCDFDANTHRYAASEQQLTHFSLANSKHFKDYFLLSLEDIKQRAETQMHSPRNLFLNAQFCCQSEDIPRLRRELNLLLQTFIENQENPLGNRVMTLTLGLYPHEI